MKAVIEDLGVPHTEVDLVLADGQSVGFDHRLRDGESISVYPVFESWDIAAVSKVRPEPLREVRFVVDVHLVTLAGYLRMLGFDAVVVRRAGRRGGRPGVTRAGADRADPGQGPAEEAARHARAARALPRAPRAARGGRSPGSTWQASCARRTGGCTGLFSRCMTCNGTLVPSGKRRSPRSSRRWSRRRTTSSPAAQAAGRCSGAGPTGRGTAGSCAEEVLRRPMSAPLSP